MSKDRETLYKDWTFAREVLQLINRDWSLELNALDFRGVHFVFDRTIGWSKEWEVITRDQAAEGVWDFETGKCYAAPITKNKGEASAVLTRLVERGFLKREKVGKFNKYSLNLSMKIGKKRKTDPETGALLPVELQRALPKRARAEANSSSDGAVFDESEGADFRLNGGRISASPEGRISAPKEKENNKRVNSNRIAVLPSSKPCRSGEENPERENPPFQKIEKSNAEKIAEAQAVTDRVQSSSRERRAAKIKNGIFRRNLHGVQSGFVPHMKGLVVAWHDLTLEHFDNAQPTTTSVTHASALYQYALSWTKARKEGEFMDYLKWIFERWDAFRVSVFSWMKDFPITPSITLVTSKKMRHKFEEAYQERETLDRWVKLDETEKRIEVLVRKHGMDRESATAKARKETGWRDEMKLLKTEARKIEIMRQNAMTEIDVKTQAVMNLEKKLKSEKAPKSLKPTEGTFGVWK